MRTTLYFATDHHGKHVWLDETPIDYPARICACENHLKHAIDDIDWTNLDKDHTPDNVGMYQAVIECTPDDTPTENDCTPDNCTYKTISCTPICLL